MPVDKDALLKDLQRRVKLLEADLKQRVKDVPELAELLQAEHAAARTADRTAESFVAWRDATLTQAAAAWVLACTFVRFLEDNELIDEPLIAGAGERRELAADRRTRHFRTRHDETDRDYLYDCFTEVAKLPGMANLYDERLNPVWRIGISGDAAKELIHFWRSVVPETGELVHDFTDPEWDTRFLGDLYQDLSESVRKRYALLQTPDFIEEFILERTLLPALDEFGLKDTRMIDPTCGSGHFLLGGFRILLDRWQKKEPATNERDLVQRALDGVYGVDINPYAAAIARFRLVIAALRESHIEKLRNAPAYRINLATGDSLLHGPRMTTAADSLAAHGATSKELEIEGEAEQLARQPGIGHAYASEDIEELNRILGQQYHAVVGNPPYITVRDTALNTLYRGRYKACYRQYSLSVPFAERFFQLACSSTNSPLEAGRVGFITANSFMKREFGKRLIENLFRNVDMQLVVDTSGAYIPGHGTPTVIVVGQDRLPRSTHFKAVLGISGEPGRPEEPRNGMVWSSVLESLASGVPFENDWVSSENVPRDSYNSHPWRLQGGAAPEVQSLIEGRASFSLLDLVDEIGFGVVTREDDAFILGDHAIGQRRGIPEFEILSLGVGGRIRHWSTVELPAVVWPYDGDTLNAQISLQTYRYLWPNRSLLSGRLAYGSTQLERGLAWFEYSMFFKKRFVQPLSIAFAFVATHNHFVFDRGGKVFKQSAPLIKLPDGTTEKEHLSLLGLLNSSTACFWMRQECFNKGGGGEKWEHRYEFAGTPLQRFPVVTSRPAILAMYLDRLSVERRRHLPVAIANDLPMSRQSLDNHRAAARTLRQQVMAVQEELDWQCYQLYGLTEEALCIVSLLDQDNECAVEVPGIELGERAFEIVMARRMAEGELETTWFERHRSTPITELPDHWSGEYRELVEKRIALIESDRNVRLIEQPEYKRRWNQESWDDQEKRALRSWLLDRLETEDYWQDVVPQTVRSLAEAAERDDDFRQVAELLEGRPDIDFFPLVESLVNGESVPFLAALRYKSSGLDKRAEWETTWELQRQEDVIDAEVAATFERLEGEDDESYDARLLTEQRITRSDRMGAVPAPPKYKQADFVDAVCWRLRGALDVPKERFISYPHCSPSLQDGQLVGWAGWDHLQQATALATHVDTLANHHGWEPEQLKPALAGLAELLPWLKQWHGGVDPEHNQRMDEYFAQFLAAELQTHGLTEADVRAWKPPAKTRARQRRKTA